MNNNSKLPILPSKMLTSLPDRIKSTLIFVWKTWLNSKFLLVYSHNTNKLDTFTNMYNEIMYQTAVSQNFKKDWCYLLLNKCFIAKLQYASLENYLLIQN